MPFLAPIGAAIAGGLSAIGGGSAIAGAAGLASGIGGALSGGRGNQQTQGQALQQGAAQDFARLTEAGAGAQDVTAATEAQRALAAELQGVASTDFTKGPSAEDISQSEGLASKLFAARNVGVRQNFLEQEQKFAQQAALQGRSPLDPVFRNKQAQAQEQQLAQLQAEQGVFATQRAQALPFERVQQRVGALQQRANVLGGLATQAMANRQALAGLGQSSASIQSQGQGGGLGGAVQGFASTFGAGLGAGQQLQGLFAGAQRPTQNQILGVSGSRDFGV